MCCQKIKREEGYGGGLASFPAQMDDGMDVGMSRECFRAPDIVSIETVPDPVEQRCTLEPKQGNTERALSRPAWFRGRTEARSHAENPAMGA